MSEIFGKVRVGHFTSDSSTLKKTIENTLTTLKQTNHNFLPSTCF